MNVAPVAIRYVATAALIMLAACERPDTQPAGSSADTTKAVKDDAGRTVQFAQPARRIISLMPAVTDMILALGAQDRLIARTAFDTDARIAHLPTTGNALNPSIEWLTAQKPDLVITWPDQGSRSVIEQLNGLGIHAYGARTEMIGDVVRTMRNLGIMLGENARADSAVRKLESELQAVRQSVADRPLVRTAYVVGIEPPMIAGPGTYIGELLTIAGAENVFAEVNTLWPQVNIEELIKRNPDAIVIATESGDAVADRIKTLPGWRDLAAVRNGRVLVVDVDLFSRPSPKLPQAARDLAAFLHPGAAH